jgi:uncharacterized protein YlaI
MAKWQGLQFKCSACDKVFAVGPEGFKAMKKRVIEHSLKHMKSGVDFEIKPVQMEKAIGMRWQCQVCKETFRLNRKNGGWEDLVSRIKAHVYNHFRVGVDLDEALMVYPIG